MNTIAIDVPAGPREKVDRLGRVHKARCPVERFWERVDRGAASRCWNWSRPSKRGYGEIWVGPGSHDKVRAHRFAWTIVNGPIPEGMHVCHRCDNRACCNPAHLFLGTNTDNNNDKISKGRVPRGEQTYNAKLTNRQALQIRKLFRAKKASRAELMQRFGISETILINLLKGRSYLDAT